MKNNKASMELSEFYSIFPWPDDPESRKGKEYFTKTLEFMERLMNNPWINKLIEKKYVKILEICGGVGYGGIALAKRLSEKNINAEVLITDLRESSLEKAKHWGKKIGVENIKTMKLDAREAHNIKENFDVVLLYGLSTPHFNPWELVKVLSSASWVLNNNGIFVVDESDRRQRIFLSTGYKWSLAEGDGENTTLSFHSGYDFIKGTVKRTYVNLKKQKIITMESFMWGLAETAALTWIFFNDVDLIHLEHTRYFIVGHNPRKLIKPGDLKKPTLFMENKDK